LVDRVIQTYDDSAFGHHVLGEPMITPDDQIEPPTDEAVDVALQSGARGAVALAGLSTAIVVAIWFAFYFLVFMPRATTP
jgi:hypothetical protein